MSPHPPDRSFAFETERLVLRPRTIEDTDNCIDMDRDPEVTRYVSGPWTDPVAHRAFIQRRTLGPWPFGLGYWTVETREFARQFVGWVILLPIDGTGPDIEIGWRLRRQFWGRGLATEAAQPLLSHAFDNLGLAEIVAEIDKRNVGSQRVAEKLGLRREGKVLHHGADSIRYSLNPTR